MAHISSFSPGDCWEATLELIDSWDDLRKRSGDIAAAIRKDPRLLLAAGANPLLALSELGYEISRDVHAAIIDRLRLPPEATKRRADLRATIIELAGRAIDPDAPDDLRQLLFVDLSLRPYPDARGCYPALPSVEPPRKQLTPAAPDPLESLLGRHPVIDPLLEYRALGASVWPLADPVAYRAIRAGATEVPLQHLRIRFKRRSAQEREGTEEDG